MFKNGGIMAYKQLVPANDWYYVFYDVNDKPIVQQIAVWAETDDGSIIGLIAIYDGLKKQPRLTCTPPIEGYYLHKEQLSEDELIAATKK